MQLKPPVKRPVACSPNGGNETLNYTYAVRFRGFDLILQVLAGVVSIAFAGLGYYIGTKDKHSEQNVVLSQDGKAMPWQQENSDHGDLFKYKVPQQLVMDR